MRRSALLALVVVACGEPPAPDFTFATDRATFDGRFERAIVSIEAEDASGEPGTGVVEFSSAVGTFVEGTQIALVGGRASATFQCDPSSVAACAGPLLLGATWRGVSRTLTVRVTPSDPRVRPLWRVVPTLVPVALHAAARAPDGTVWAVGDRGTLLQYAQGSWGAPVSTRVTSALRAITIDDQGLATIVGDDGVVLEGQPGSLTALASGSGEHFTAVLRAGSLRVATRSGAVGEWSGGGFSFSIVSSAPINALTLLEGDVIAAGDEGVFRQSGTQWQDVTLPIPARWVSLRVEQGALWLLGRRTTITADPVLVKGPGPAWSSATLPNGAVRAMAWGLGSADRYVVTDTSVFRQQSNSSWEDLEAPSGGSAIVPLGSVNVLVVGPPGISLLRVR